VTNCAGLATLAWAGEPVEPGSRVSCFGHFGDGNIHFSVSQPSASADREEDLPAGPAPPSAAGRDRPRRGSVMRFEDAAADGRCALNSGHSPAA